MIETESLSCSFGPVRAVDGLTFQVYEGEVFGLLGPNGAGKTAVRLLNGVLRPSGGKARVLGLDPVRDGCRLRQQTGVLAETPSFYKRLTAQVLTCRLYQHGQRMPKQFVATKFCAILNGKIHSDQR